MSLQVLPNCVCLIEDWLPIGNKQHSRRAKLRKKLPFGGQLSDPQRTNRCSMGFLAEHARLATCLQSTPSVHASKRLSGIGPVATRQVQNSPGPKACSCPVKVAVLSTVAVRCQIGEHWLAALPMPALVLHVEVLDRVDGRVVNAANHPRGVVLRAPANSQLSMGAWPSKQRKAMSPEIKNPSTW